MYLQQDMLPTVLRDPVYHQGGGGGGGGGGGEGSFYIDKERILLKLIKMLAFHEKSPPGF